MIEDCTAVIMAGGQSQRMGCDKATLVIGDASLLQRVAAILEPLFSSVAVSVRAVRSDIELPQICDVHADCGPLAGLHAALAEVGTSWVFAVATDMPFLQPALIEILAQRRQEFQAIVPVVHGHVQPLAAFYSRTALPEIEAVLAGRGKRSLRAVLERLNVLYIDESELLVADPGLRSFFDLDTPQDLVAARSCAGAHDA